MKCQTTDIEIETLVGRIRDKDIDLQPSFQRGEIWSPQKKKKLIDSILRGWRIPPIHVVESHDNLDEVLDGQQRLATIRDFYDNKIPVDGTIEPYSSEISALDGMLYKDLPVGWQRQFRKYPISVVRLTEYEPEEPAELFYRLNQPSALTSAEQRNAYIGETRNQVKRLSNYFSSLGADKEKIGFSNSRLAYDEIISKFCYVVEIGTLSKKITSNDISKKYRENEPFSDDCFNTVSNTLKHFMDSISSFNDFKFSFNKATLFSWLIYIRQHLDVGSEQLIQVIANFEYCRSIIKGKYKNIDGEYENRFLRLQKDLPFLEIMLNTFNQRSSMGSTDALSIIYRDIIIAIFGDSVLLGESQLLQSAIGRFQERESMNYVLESLTEQYGWGEKF